MKQIRILTVTTSGLKRKEGISTIILDYYSYLDRDCFELDIIAAGDYSPGLVEEFQNIGITIRYLPSRKKNTVKYFQAFIKLFIEQKYDAIYIHGSSAIMSIELLIAKYLGCKIRIVHSHNTFCEHNWIDKLLRPLFYKSYTIALACGVESGKWLYRSRKFDVIKNGREVAKYRFDPVKRNEIRRCLTLCEDTYAIGHVGNFTEQKNQKYIIGILREIISLNRNIKFYFMGDGEKRKEVEQLIKNNNLNQYVVFTGSIDNVPDMLQAMDVMLLPSLYEGLPLVVVEWQIAGLPCILSDTITEECAYTDLVHFMSLSDGYLAWAEKILLLKNNNRNDIAEDVISQTIENGYDLENNVKTLQNFFVMGRRDDSGDIRRDKN